MECKKDIGFLIKQISDRMKTLADADMKKYDLTFSQARVLQYIGFHGGQSTQKQIEDYLGVAHPTVVGLVSRLEKNGFVICQKSESNKRQKMVLLTDRAKEFGLMMEAKKSENEQRLFGNLSEEERETLKTLLTKVVDNLYYKGI